MFGAPKSRLEVPAGDSIIVDGRARCLGGGVEGGFIRALPPGFAGEGDVAR